ncbi:3528_t:CDS:10, partial [Scutellospora calospora]
LVNMSLFLTPSGNIKNEKSAYINMVYNYDWSSTLLGPMDSWEPTLKIATNLCLQSAFPSCIYLHPSSWISLYNEAWIPIVKARHPAIGKTFKEVWPEAYDIVIPQFENVRITGKGIIKTDTYYELQRDGYIEETYFYYTFSPIFKSDGTVNAIFAVAQDTTHEVLNARRLKILNELGRQIPKSACCIMTKTLSNNADIPYAFIYFVDHKANAGSESLVARLVATTFEDHHIPDYLPDTPEIIYLAKDDNKSYNTYIELKRVAATYSFLKCDSWPIKLVIKEGKHVKVLLKDDSQAVLLPTKISLFGGRVLSIVLICGVNRLRSLDEQYMEFLQLVTNQMNTYLEHGNTVEEEKKRSKILAELNYQKIIFFQGISHELKTPLTLMLSPLNDVINVCPQDAPIMPFLKIIQRNTHRLLKLINVLLQFSNIEAGQLKAHYRETNIAEFTLELTSDFKNMAQKLGLGYNIDIPHPDEFNQAVGDKIYLDHDIYETIVYNLCSNALKHTWNGCITIRLYIDYKDTKRMIILEVSDTGIGIPENALPKIFERFYRVKSQGSRSHEGTGIGLALVKELITRHGGDITVTSKVNQGTTFKCWFPIGCEHLPINQIDFNNLENPIKHDQELYIDRQLYLEESSQWIKNSTSEVIYDTINKLSIDDKRTYNDNKMLVDYDLASEKYQVLLVDDNNDMRIYLADLLKEFDVLCACDGQEAIRILKNLNKLPDLILSGK